MKYADKLRRWMQPLRWTILHPQWLALRNERGVRRWVKDKTHGRVLDIGCAGGWARHVVLAECEYVGLDYPVTARGSYGTRPDIFADSVSLPFHDDTFDTVLLLEVLEHIAEPHRALSEIKRVLKVGGVLLLSVPFLYPLHDVPHDYRRYTGLGLQHVVSRAGMECTAPVPQNTGFRAVALLAGIACAESVLSATRVRRWRLAFAPLLITCIPVINIVGWLLGWIGDSGIFASGHSVEARKP